MKSLVVVEPKDSIFIKIKQKFMQRKIEKLILNENMLQTYYISLNPIDRMMAISLIEDLM